MVATKQDCTLPQPNGWPRQVRSAVMHAISLAHASMTATRGWAAKGSYGRASSGSAIPAGASVCLPQQVAVACP